MQLAIIVPCYNEFARLPLPTFKHFILKYPDSRLCFVNDGSRDKTDVMLDNFTHQNPENVDVVHLTKNLGKGEAVRQGMCFMLAKYKMDYLCYLDADLSSPLEEVIRLADIMNEQKQLLFAFGSRVSVFGSQINRVNYRHYGGRVIATMIDMVLKLSIYDTQCGLKMFHNDLAKEVFKTPFLTRWLFDVEIFSKMKLLYSKKDLSVIMKEIPVNEWTEKGDSKVRFGDVIRIPFALLNIRAKYNFDELPMTSEQVYTNALPLISQPQSF